MTAGDDTTVVPAGHRVTSIRVSPFPHVLTSGGAARIAHFGIESDDQVADVERTFERVQRELRAPVGPVLLNSSRQRLSELFAPRDPHVVPVPSLLIWTGGYRCFTGFVESEAGAQRLLALFSSVAGLPNAPMQLLYLADSSLPNVQAIGARLGALGIEIRRPHADGTIVVEVERPEGVVLTAVVGDPLVIESSARLLPLVPDAREPSRGQPLARSSRLRRLVIDASRTSDPGAVVTLARALLASAHPLLLICDAQGRTAPMRWDDGRSALPAFTDVLSLQTTARALGHDPGGVAMAHFDIAGLCRFALERQAGLALNVYAPGPLYLMLTPETVQALATGRVPERDALEREARAKD